MAWFEIIGEIARKIFVAVAKVSLWFVYVVLKAIEVLLREINGALNKYLFPNGKKL